MDRGRVLQLLRDPDHEEVCVSGLSHEPESVVEGDHLVGAVQGDLVAAESLAQLHQRGHQPIGELEPSFVSGSLIKS